MKEQSATQQPTSEQLFALENYRANHGRNWKMHLWHDWMNAEYNGATDAHLLQQVRNNLGPSWLHKLNLDKALFAAGLNPGRKAPTR